MKRCSYLNQVGILNFSTYIKPCCLGGCPRLVTSQKIKDYPHQNTKEFIEEVIRARKELADLWQEGKPEVCGNCAFLTETDSPYNGEISHIIVSNYRPCNCKCIYCPFWRDQSPASDSFYEITPILGELLKYKKTGFITPDFSVTWTGGEPSLHPAQDFIDACQITKDHGGSILITSNCIKFAPHFENLMAGYRKSGILCSIDAGDRETFRKIKGVDKFDQVVENVLRYAGSAKHRSQMKIKFITTPENEGNIDQFIEFVTTNSLSYVIVEENKPRSRKCI